jgi:hypothetical protein
MALDQQEPRNEQREREAPEHSERDVGGENPRLPLYARVMLALYGLAFVAEAFLPAAVVSEAVWVTLFLGTLIWEFVGVKKERDWGQEPLTHLYADRLMRRGVLGLPGFVFRVAWLSLFSWWIVHWVVRVPW